VCSTPKGIKGWDSIATGAASTIGSSTPKGIKGWDSVIVGHRRGIHIHVLNAKRHQRLGQGSLSRSASWPLHVLNAKRHQRLGQCGITEACGRTCGCSTPKGIKGWDR